MAVAKQDLKKMAEELESLIAAPVAAPRADITESYFIAAETPQAEPPPNNDHLIPQLVRSVVEYALTKSEASETPQNIGGAITVGLNEAVKHLNLDRAKVVEAVTDFMDDLTESVLDSLGE